MDIQKTVVCHKYFNLKIISCFQKKASGHIYSPSSKTNSSNDPNKRDELPPVMWPHVSLDNSTRKVGISNFCKHSATD